MSRFLLLLLVLLLPLQAVWAGAAEYCQHETEPALTAHLGHHEHQHKGDVESKKPAGSKFLGDADCGVCNAAGTPLVLGAPALSLVAAAAAGLGELRARPITSALARAPDRPQWPRLA